MEEMKTILKLDKRFTIGGSAVFILLVVGGWLYFSGALYGSADRPGDCLILPKQYCDKGIAIEYLGYDAFGFNLPESTPIYMPFDGNYFEDSLNAGDFVRFKLGTPNDRSFLFVTGRYESLLISGSKLSKGDLVATVLINNEEGPIDDESNSNFIMYTVNYDPNVFFGQ
ncbi:MAG: hypothetical protein NUV78_00120 [Candidatus Zambryskibacteria bacterium]|nr:hypothetical protein [Candidatus Zambryskibacteria bacterium]